MSENVQEKTCRRIEKVLTEAKVEAWFNSVRQYDPWRTMRAERIAKENGTRTSVEELKLLAKELQAAINEFNDFIRDHRSQDSITLNVVSSYADLCSACGDKWETYMDEESDGTVTRRCASCGAAVKEADGGT